MLWAATFWEEGVPLKQLPFLMSSMIVPKNSQKCRASVVTVLPWCDARFWMSQANASKSSMWSGLSLLMLLSDALLADILALAAAAGRGVECVLL